MGFYETQEANYEYRKSMKESYNEGYEAGYKQGKADAEKEMHDNILRYRMPEPWKGEAK